MNKKSPSGIRPRRCSPSPRGPKHIKLTQDTSLSPRSERHGEYLFDRAKTGGLGQVTTKKNKKSPRGIRPCRCCHTPRVQNKIRALTCVAEDTTSICLAKQKPKVWGK